MIARGVIDDASTVARTDGPASDHAASNPDPSIRLRRRARRMAVLAVIACPCHVSLVASVLAFIGFGSSAAVLRDNLVTVSLGLGGIAVVSLGMAVRSSRAALTCPLPTPLPAPPVLRGPSAQRTEGDGHRRGGKRRRVEPVP